MSLTYSKITQRSTTFLRMFGISAEKLYQMLPAISELWAQEVIGRYKHRDRSYDLSIEGMMLMLLYCSYTTQMFIGYIAARVFRIIRILLGPLFADVMAISKTRHLTEDEIRHLIVDTGSATNRASYQRSKEVYSGKKKRHTVKTELRITNRGCIVDVSKSVPGHDFALFKEEQPSPSISHLFVALGYLVIGRYTETVSILIRQIKTSLLIK